MAAPVFAATVTTVIAFFGLVAVDDVTAVRVCFGKGEETVTEFVLECSAHIFETSFAGVSCEAPGEGCVRVHVDDDRDVGLTCNDRIVEPVHETA